MKGLIRKLRNRIEKDIERYTARVFIQDVIYVGLSEYFDLIATVILTTVLARVLGPDGYGQYKLVIGTVSVIGLVSLLSKGASMTFVTKYSEYNEQGLVAKEDRLKDLLIVITAVMSIFAFGVSVSASKFIDELIYQDKELYTLLLLASSRFLFRGLTSIPETLLRALKRMKLFSIYRSASSTSSKLFAVLLVLGQYGVAGAIVGVSILGPLFSFILGIYFVRDNLRRFSIPSPHNAFKGFKEEQRFLGAITLEQINNIVSETVLLIILGATASNAEVAFFAIALFGTKIPNRFGSSLTTNLVQRLPRTKVNDPEKFGEHVRTVTVYSTGIITLMSIFGVIGTPFIVPLLLGSSYKPVIPIALLLFLRPIIQGTGVIFGPAYRALDKMEYSASIRTFGTLTEVIIGLLIIPQHGAIGAVGALITGSIFIYLGQGILLWLKYIPELKSGSAN